MTLEQYIKELLFEYECVTVPGFGAFLTRSINFSSDDLTGQFFPSNKKVTFNALLVSNDGILANYFAKKQNISYEKSLRLIEKEVKVWKKKLLTQTLYIGSIGKIKLKNKKFIFEPYGKLNFDSSSYGLRPITIKPITFRKASENKLLFTPVSSLKNISSIKTFYKYASVFLVLVTLSFSCFYLMQQYVYNQRLLNQEIAQKKIQNKVQSSTFNLGSLNSITLSIDVLKKQGNNKLNTTYYTIIAGTFRNKSYAKRKIKTLKKEGYDSEMAQINPKGMFRVAYGRFESKREAVKLLYSLKNIQKKDAWYLIER